MNKIEVQNIYKIFGKRPEQALAAVQAGISKAQLRQQSGHILGLREITLSIPAGQTFVIMGLSGSGKSTLIRHFNRLIDPTAGDILVDGQSLMQMSPAQLQEFRRHKISMVFQRFGLMPHHCVLENVAYGLKIQGVSKAERQQQAQRWIELVGLQGFEDAYPEQLSGGMQQRVGLARALCTNPDILLMDEAFSALDPLIRREMQDQLMQIQNQLHKTIVFITHDLDEALRLGNQIAILKDGEIQQVGTPQQILLQPANDYVDAFVQDINRSRVLTAALAAQPVACIAADSSPQQALQQLQQQDIPLAMVVDAEQHLLGMVEQQQLQQQQSDNLQQLTASVPSIAADALLEEAIQQLAEAGHPLPVVDAEQRLQGLISADSALKALTDTPCQQHAKPPVS